jgi:hypothetical protein
VNPTYRSVIFIENREAMIVELGQKKLLSVPTQAQGLLLGLTPPVPNTEISVLIDVTAYRSYSVYF